MSDQHTPNRDNLKTRRSVLLERIDPMWDANPVWRSVDFGYGWDGLLNDALDMLEGQSFTIVQLKEKFGTGRFYISHSHDEACNHKEPDPTKKCMWYHPSCKVERAVSWWEKGTEYLCESCGFYSSVSGGGGGWITNKCDQCYETEKNTRRKIQE